MSVAQERASPELGIAPLNFIYSCAICSATFADAYEGHEETVQDLSDGVNPRNRIVTRTFLATCCHVFCAKHLENGGKSQLQNYCLLTANTIATAPAFHPAGQRPRAPCPVCVKDKGDSEPRDLYSVRGFKKDQHDPLIPPAWFTAPPIRLDGNSKEMEALRVRHGFRAASGSRLTKLVPIHRTDTILPKHICHSQRSTARTRRSRKDYGVTAAIGHAS